MIYPLVHHSNLQTLHIIAPNPMFPSWRAFIPFTAASPISMPVWNGLGVKGIKSLVMQAAGSHFLHAFALNSVSIVVQYYTFRWMLTHLPSPTPGDGLDLDVYPLPTEDPAPSATLPSAIQR